MKLRLVRGEQQAVKSQTLGILYINGVKFCDTLEDQDRVLEITGPTGKVPGRTAIPRGVYKVTVDMSNRFKKLMPHVLNVPGFEGIRIHAGNTEADTEGCILLGSKGGLGLVNSGLMVGRFMDKITAAIKAGETVSLEVV